MGNNIVKKRKVEKLLPTSKGTLFVKETKTMSNTYSIRIFNSDDNENEDQAKQEYKRQFQFVSLLREIVATERNYVTDLETIVEVFHNPLRSNKILSAKELQTIFSNIHDVLRINKVLLSEIKIQLPELEKESEFEAMQMYCIQLCNIFLKYGDMLKVYTFYCNNKFSKYPLLFKELAKNTLPSESQYCCLEQICNKLNNILAQVNDNKRIAENIDKMVSLRSSINQLPTDFELLIPARRFIKEGDILLFAETAYKTRHLFLFNDMLLIAKKARLSGTYHYITHIMQRDAVVVTDENKYGIRIENKEKDVRYSILVSSTAEQQEWLRLIQDTLQLPSKPSERSSLPVPSRPLPPPPSRDSKRESLSRSVLLRPATPEPDKQPAKRSSYTSYGTPTGFSYLATTNDAAPHKPLSHAKTNVRMHQTQQIVGACLDDLLQMFSQAYKAYKSNAPIKQNTSSLENIIRSNITKMKALNAEDVGEDYQNKADALQDIESFVEQFLEMVRGWLDGLANKCPPAETEVKLLQKLQSQRKRIGDLMSALNK